MSTMLATLWFPSLNPIGAPSIWPLFICGLGVVLTEKFKSSDVRWIKETLIVIVPPILFGFVAASGTAIGAFKLLSLSFPWQSYRNYPDADDFCANYLYLAFALIISLRGWRVPSVAFRALGCLEAAIFAFLIIVEFSGLAHFLNL